MATGELSPRAAARALGVNVKTIRKLLADGELKHRVTRVRLRRRIYIPAAEIQRLKAARK